MQHKIRENAMAQSTFFQEMGQWEKDIRKRDKDMRKTKGTTKATAPIRGSKRIGVQNTNAGETAARHTYDKGYGKWEAFNVDQALEEVEAPVVVEERRKPVEPPQDAEAAQRQVGNACFAKADYDGAVKSYTICLGLKKDNLVALSNRSMAYLKLKQFHNAEIDATAALAIDSTHVKSLQRRATARDALGKHRAALVDVISALNIQPSNAALSTHRSTIRNHISSCVDHAPFHPIPLPSS